MDHSNNVVVWRFYIHDTQNILCDSYNLIRSCIMAKHKIYIFSYDIKPDNNLTYTVKEYNYDINQFVKVSDFETIPKKFIYKGGSLAYKIICKDTDLSPVVFGDIDGDGFNITEKLINNANFVNNDGGITTLGDFRKNYWDIFFNENKNGLFKLDSEIFIRPCSGCKEFSGTTAYLHDIEQFLISRKDISILPDDFSIFISRNKFITCEWRFIIGGLNILGSSSYNLQMVNSEISGSPYAAQNFVLNILPQLNKDSLIPSDLFILDVGLLEINKFSSFKIIEMNCFNFSNLYKCNTEELINYIERYWKFNT